MTSIRSNRRLTTHQVAQHAYDLRYLVRERSCWGRQVNSNEPPAMRLEARCSHDGVQARRVHLARLNAI